MNDDRVPSSNVPVSVVSDDPYAILKLDHDASDAMIQSAYKTLSRTFHPDKHPPGPDCDAAQQVFVKFKNAHDLLMDPVLRQVYDYYYSNHHIENNNNNNNNNNNVDDHDGSISPDDRRRRCDEAIRIIKMTMYSKNPNALYPILLRLHMQGQTDVAKQVFVKELQQTQLEREGRSARIGATLDFPCSIQSSAWLGEGTGPIDIPELSDATISVTTSAASSDSSKWDMNVAMSSSVKNGTGRTYGNIRVGYKPHWGTEITSSIDLMHPIQLALATTRKFANRTIVTTSVRTLTPDFKKLGFVLASHRDLWQNLFRASWALGIGNDLDMHFGFLSFKTLSDQYPTCTLRLNMGSGPFPIKLSVRHEFGNDDAKNRAGYLSYAWGPKGVEYKAMLSRLLTSNVSIAMGIRHATRTGLTWLFQVERDSFSFRLPIRVCTITNPSYRTSLFRFSILSLLIDDVIGDIISNLTHSITNLKQQEQRYRTNNSAAKDPDSSDGSHITTTKKKIDAEQQVLRMKPTAQRNMEREKQKNGLFIYEAEYYIYPSREVQSARDGTDVVAADLGTGPLVSVDVTTQLQFWVQDSKLYIPAGSKGMLLGFYPLVDLQQQQRRRHDGYGGPISWIRQWIDRGRSTNTSKTHGSATAGKRFRMPQLRVRYTFGDDTYEITIDDEEMLILPNPNATALGPSDNVR